MDGLGTTHGRIHVGKQEINKIQTRKMKGLKRTKEEVKHQKAAKRSAKQMENVNRLKKQKLA